MTSTRRGLNRLFVFVVGLLLLALGLGAVAVATVPVVRDGWSGTAPSVQRSVDEAHAASALSPAVSWITVGVLAVLVILALLLIAFVLKQGHGRTGRLLRETREGEGTTVVDARVAETLLQDALAGRDELVSSHVTTFDVTGTPTLNIAVTARRGVSPRAVARAVDEAVVALDAVLGREVPAYLHISGGFRARTTAPARVH